MLETEAVPSAETVKHVDRCLSCLACVSACPSGVDYRRLVDHARDYIEARYRRPLADRWLRALLAAVLPDPKRFGLAIRLARAFRWAAPLIPGRLKGLIVMAPIDGPAPAAASPAPVIGQPIMRVALLGGCVQSV